VAVNTLRPHPVTTTDNGVFDTRHGTVHLMGTWQATANDMVRDNDRGTVVT
jgi:hypothetical protein